MNEPLNTELPFTNEQAALAGITENELRGPRYRQLLRGVYLDANAPVDPWVLGRAALLLAPPGTIVARHTAAALWGGSVPDSWRVHVTTLWPGYATRAEQMPDRHRRRGGGRGCSAAARRQLEWGRMAVEGVDARVSINHSRTTTLRGIRLTDPIRTFLDLAEDLDLVDLVVLGDSLVRRELVSPDELMSAAAEPGRHHRKARRAAAYVRTGTASAPESRLRMLLVLAGLPEPEVDVQLRDDDGELLRQLDLGYREEKVAVEYDGRQHIERIQEWERDIDRREELVEWDWRIVTVVASGIWKQPGRTLAKVIGALRARGRRVSITSDEWERYFGRGASATRGSEEMRVSGEGSGSASAAG